MKKFIITIALFFTMTTSALAAELIMFSMASCIYCQNFLKEVAPTYAEQEFAKLLPLRIISMDRKIAPRWFDKAYNENKIDGIRGTPTFIVFDNGEEQARLIGYTGKENFYADMKKFVENNRVYLERTVGKNTIPYESETEMDYKKANKEIQSIQKTSNKEGSHSSSNSVSQQQHPTVPFMPPNLGAKQKKDTNPHTKDKDKYFDGVIKSHDIMDHQYQTPEEAIKATEWFKCEGIHSHKINGKIIWMPCKMEIR